MGSNPKNKIAIKVLNFPPKNMGPNGENKIATKEYVFLPKE